LQDCLEDDASHVLLGDSGDYVGLIQEALVKLGEGVIAAKELSEMHYGTSTARSVKQYKTKRQIINRRYQQLPDDIVGRITIERLDRDMVELEKKRFSQLISPSRKGLDHNHAACPPLEAGAHEATPIRPQGWGNMVNIYGDGETDYDGFKDYAIDPEYAKNVKGKMPFTWEDPSGGGVPDHSVSDIFMRSAPVYDDDDMKIGRIKPRSTIFEIQRMAMPGCRLTYAGPKENTTSGPKILKLGILMETIYVDKAGNLLPFGTPIGRASMTVYLLTIIDPNWKYY